MQILSIKGATRGDIRYALYHAFENSRFCIGGISDKGAGLKIEKIRLREKKPYCGSHPMSCELRPQFGRPARHNFLEGADWVEANDMINDVLDNLNASANVRTSVVKIRKGSNRRIHYGAYLHSQSTMGQIWEWRLDEDDEHYQDFRGLNAPNSWYPEGTPGEYMRKEMANAL